MQACSCNSSSRLKTDLSKSLFFSCEPKPHHSKRHHVCYKVQTELFDFQTCWDNFQLANYGRLECLNKSRYLQLKWPIFRPSWDRDTHWCAASCQQWNVLVILVAIFHWDLVSPWQHLSIHSFISKPGYILALKSLAQRMNHATRWSLQHHLLNLCRWGLWCFSS